MKAEEMLGYELKGLERRYMLGEISAEEILKFRMGIVLIVHNAYKFQGKAQRYRNYLPDHIAIHVRKQYLEELHKKGLI